MIIQTYTVAGMNCGHCVHAVTEELRTLAGVSDISIDLADNGDTPVTVTSDAPLDDAAVRAAIDEAGYELTGTTA